MTALNPGAPPRPTPTAKVRKPLKARPHRIPDSIREAVLDSANRTCEWCHRPGGKLVIHHKLLRSQGGNERDLSLLAALHPICHVAVHASPYDAQERGFIIGVGSNHR
jgi:5-methylcytosine-specific restriction endonuclease McrA